METERTSERSEKLFIAISSSFSASPYSARSSLLLQTETKIKRGRFKAKEVRLKYRAFKAGISSFPMLTAKKRTDEGGKNRESSIKVRDKQGLSKKIV